MAGQILFAVAVALASVHGIAALPAEHESLQPGILHPKAIQKAQWEIQRDLKNQRTNDAIPMQWKLKPSVIMQAKTQKAFLGSNNNGNTIEQFISTLPAANFTNPYFPNVKSSATKTIQITNTDPVDLVTAMEQKVYTAVDVVTAFCLRAAVIHQVLPVLLDVAFNQSVHTAHELDQYLNTTGKLKGGLHGLPVTFKDLFHAEHMETSGSYVGWFEPPKMPSPPRTQAEYRYLTINPTNFGDNPKTFNSNVTQMLVNQGAIPIAKTSTMQSTWWFDTQNNYLDFLYNPYQLNLSSGGSSGGEGVLQALGGAAFGIGEDSGGSVSMPSSLNGLYSLKPSSGFQFTNTSNQELVPIPGRMSTENAVNFGTCLATSELTAAGIIARSLRAVQYIYTYTVGQPPISSNSASNSFAYADTNGAITPHPPIQRAMAIVKGALRNQTGVRLQKYGGTQPSIVDSVHHNLTLLDGIIDNVHYRNVTGEPWVSTLDMPTNYNPPPWNADDQHWLEVAENLRDQYRSEYESYFERNNIDALVLPSFASTDWDLDNEGDIVSYNSYVNCLNVPSVTMFVTFANAKLDPKPTNFKGFGTADQQHMATYNPQEADGTPISVLIMGRYNGEIALLEAVQRISQALSQSH